MLEKLKDRLIDEAQDWYKFWSSKLAILWGIIVTVFWNDPTLLGQLLEVMPPEVRAWLSPVVLALVAGLPIFVRLLKQQKLQNTQENKP